jgi:S1-C subfamily serine protease
MQPRETDVAFDLRAAFDAVVALRAEIPPDAFTASILGTERTGSGVVIRDDGLVLTIGYLITEASSVWLTGNDGSVVQGHPLAYDFATGFGLVQPLGRPRWPALARGSRLPLAVDDEACVLSHGGRAHALRTTVFARREFAGFWEYLVEGAIFTTPPHPEWSGAALLDDDGRLAGIGSLLLQEKSGEDTVDGNMFVPVDLLDPILEELLATGRSARSARPWLGMYTTDAQGRLVVSGVAPGGPAERAGVATGDLVVAVAGERVATLPELFRRIWREGPAGTEIALTLARGGAPLHVRVRSGDRDDFLKKPTLQ